MSWCDCQISASYAQISHFELLAGSPRAFISTSSLWIKLVYSIADFNWKKEPGFLKRADQDCTECSQASKICCLLLREDTRFVVFKDASLNRTAKNILAMHIWHVQAHWCNMVSYENISLWSDALMSICALMFVAACIINLASSFCSVPFSLCFWFHLSCLTAG